MEPDYNAVTAREVQVQTWQDRRAAERLPAVPPAEVWCLMGSPEAMALTGGDRAVAMLAMAAAALSKRGLLMVVRADLWAQHEAGYRFRRCDRTAELVVRVTGVGDSMRAVGIEVRR